MLCNLIVQVYLKAIFRLLMITKDKLCVIAT